MSRLHASLLAVSLSLAASMPASSIPASAQDRATVQSASTFAVDAPALQGVAGPVLTCRVLHKRNGSEHSLVLRLTAKDAVGGTAQLVTWMFGNGQTTKISTWRDLAMEGGDAVEIVMLTQDRSLDRDLFGKVTIGDRSRNCY